MFQQILTITLAALTLGEPEVSSVSQSSPCPDVISIPFNGMISPTPDEKNVADGRSTIEVAFTSIGYSIEAPDGYSQLLLSTGLEVSGTYDLEFGRRASVAYILALPQLRAHTTYKVTYTGIANLGFCNARQVTTDVAKFTTR